MRIIVMTLLLLISATTVLAKTPVCSNQTLKGDYVVIWKGFLPGTLFVPPGQVAQPTPFPFPMVDARPFAAKDRLIFDGFGTFQGITIENTGGIIEKNIWINGTYEVNPYCEGTIKMRRHHDPSLHTPDVLALINDGEVSITVKPNGKRFWLLGVTVPGVQMLQATAKRLWK